MEGLVYFRKSIDILSICELILCPFLQTGLSLIPSGGFILGVNQAYVFAVLFLTRQHEVSHEYGLQIF